MTSNNNISNNAIPTKKCNNCKEEKPYSAYDSSRHRVCKDCRQRYYQGPTDQERKEIKKNKLFPLDEYNRFQVRINELKKEIENTLFKDKIDRSLSSLLDILESKKLDVSAETVDFYQKLITYISYYINNKEDKEDYMSYMDITRYLDNYLTKL